MSERTRNSKAPAQDGLGFLFCLVGGFFAVSVVLFLSGQKPKPGLVSALTSPVMELINVLGPAAALFLSLGLAALGTMLFLRTTTIASTRPLLALLAGSLGVSLIAGIFLEAEAKGVVGAWLPGLVPGLAGSALGFVLGVALAWLGWTLVVGQRVSRTSTAELLAPRVGLTPRHEASGVSPAEAALLVSDTRSPVVRSAPRREPAAPVALRDESIRPFPPPDATSTASTTRATRVETPVKPVRVEPLQAGPSRAAEPMKSVIEPFASESEAALTVATPPAPSWEGVPEDVQEEEEENAQRLSEALNEEFETEEASADEEDEEALAGELDEE
jgi:hypothetical protein